VLAQQVIRHVRRLSILLQYSRIQWMAHYQCPCLMRSNSSCMDASHCVSIINVTVLSNAALGLVVLANSRQGKACVSVSVALSEAMSASASESVAHCSALSLIVLAMPHCKAALPAGCMLQLRLSHGVDRPALPGGECRRRASGVKTGVSQCQCQWQCQWQSEPSRLLRRLRRQGRAR